MLGAHHVPERLCSGIVYLVLYNKVMFTFFILVSSLSYNVAVYRSWSVGVRSGRHGRHVWVADSSGRWRWTSGSVMTGTVYSSVLFSLPHVSLNSLEQAVNLLCAQANSASYPQWDGKWVVAYALRGEGLVPWLGRWYVCVLHRGSNISVFAIVGNGWPHNAPRYH